MRNASEYKEIHFIGVDALIDHLENRWRYSNINDAIRYLTASLKCCNIAAYFQAQYLSFDAYWFYI